MSKTFGEILRNARIQQNLTAKAICEAIGMSQATYSQYENNKHKNISMYNVKKICEFLHLDANQLLGLNGDKFSFVNDKRVEYKQQLIEQLNNWIEEVKRANRELLNKSLEEFKINDDVDKVEVEYQQIKVSSKKNESLGVISLCCVISKFMEDMLNKIEEEMKTNFDKELLRLYVQCENILKDILSK